MLTFVQPLHGCVKAQQDLLQGHALCLPPPQPREMEALQPVQLAMQLQCAVPRRRPCFRRLRPGQNLGKDHETLVISGVASSLCCSVAAGARLIYSGVE